MHSVFFFFAFVLMKIFQEAYIYIYLTSVRFDTFIVTETICITSEIFGHDAFECSYQRFITLA